VKKDSSERHRLRLLFVRRTTYAKPPL